MSELSRPKRVMLSINTSWNIYNFRKSLIQALQQAGYIVITAAPEDVYTPRLIKIVDRHIRVPMANAGTSPWQDFVLFWRYFMVMRGERPDIYLGYTIKPNIYGTFAARLLGIPTINNVSGLGTAFIRDSWLTKVVSVLYRSAFSLSNHIFFQNPEDQVLFIERRMVKEAKTSVLPGSGIDLSYFAPENQEHKQSDTDSVRFVLIARMLWDKGIGEYVDAARLVRAKYPNVLLRLVGPYGIDNKTAIARHTIEAWMQEGVIEYLGETDDVRTVIQQHDCVVLPSYREGMSRVLLEGAAMGKPLIATDVPGCRHIVTHGENGLLCEVKNTQDLAEKLIEFVEMPAEAKREMGAKSRHKAEQEFDEQLVLNEYLKRIKALTSADA